jgi:transcriptional regulator with XRE-family HTH domain
MVNSQLVLEIQKKFEENQSFNRKVSQRSFASSIGLASSELSEFLRGKRTFSEKKAKLVIDKLGKTAQEKAAIYRRVFLDEKADDLTLTLNDEFFSYVSDPVYFAFLQLINAFDFKYDVNALQVKKIIIRLKTLKLIQDCSDKGIKRTYAGISSTEDITSSALKSHHLNDLEKIKESILCTPIHLRDISSLTFLFSLEDIDKAKEILRKAQDEIEALGSGHPKRDVYKVSTYLYPMTKY